LLAAMRCKEVRLMRVCDIKKTKEEFAQYGLLWNSEIWIYVLESHKTDRHIGTKIIPLGLEEQDIIQKYLDTDAPQRPVFLTKRGKQYSSKSYSQMVKKAIDRNELHKFVPTQLRHTGLTNTSIEHGRDVARSLAGHTSEKTTAIYDHGDFEKAMNAVLIRNKQYQRFAGGGNPQPLKLYTGELE
ncbi:MAG: tyrosine-type recombinase/integrase, partial [Planctomycetaceae bacterium]|nr:tyrosine-type recombinase/integrase [Planctomycetaceae bacterium]